VDPVDGHNSLEAADLRRTNRKEGIVTVKMLFGETDPYE
jgi:hypothetical protein